jgi:hypothetical protein
VNICDDDQAPGLEKEERKKNKKGSGKGDIHRAILFLVIETL